MLARDSVFCTTYYVNTMGRKNFSENTMCILYENGKSVKSIKTNKYVPAECEAILKH